MDSGGGVRSGRGGMPLTRTGPPRRRAPWQGRPAGAACGTPCGFLVHAVLPRCGTGVVGSACRCSFTPRSRGLRACGMPTQAVVRLRTAPLIVASVAGHLGEPDAADRDRVTRLGRGYRGRDRPYERSVRFGWWWSPVVGGPTRMPLPSPAGIAERSCALLPGVQVVIDDEILAVAGNKRGSHLGPLASRRTACVALPDGWARSGIVGPHGRAATEFTRPNWRRSRSAPTLRCRASRGARCRRGLRPSGSGARRSGR